MLNVNVLQNLDALRDFNPVNDFWVKAFFQIAYNYGLCYYSDGAVVSMIAAMRINVAVQFIHSHSLLEYHLVTEGIQWSFNVWNKI